MDGVDRLLPLDLTRVDRAVLAALIGNDYSNGGVFGVGVNTILAGLIDEGHKVEWTLENALMVRDALNTDLGMLNGSSDEAKRRRTTLGLHQSKSIVQVGESTVRGLIDAVDAALGRDVEIFDTREIPWVEHHNDDMRVRFNNGTRPPPRPYDAKGAEKTFMYRRPVPGQPHAEQRRFPPSPSPFLKLPNPLVPLRNSPMPRADDTSTEANRRRELARRIGSSRSSTIRITAISSGASLHAAMLRRAGTERDEDEGGDEGTGDAAKPKPKGGDERKSKRKGKHGGKRGKGKKEDNSAVVKGGQEGDAAPEQEQEPPSNDKDDKSESRVRLDSQFDTVCTDPLRTRSIERTLHRDQIELRPPRDVPQTSPTPKQPSAPGSAKQRTRLASSGIPNSAPRVGGVFTGGNRPRANGPANIQVARSDKPVADILSLLSLSFALSTLEQNDVADEWVGACGTDDDFSYLANKARGRDFHRDLARLMCGLGGEFIKGGGQGEGGTLKKVGSGGQAITLDEHHVAAVRAVEAKRPPNVVRPAEIGQEAWSVVVNPQATAILKAVVDKAVLSLGALGSALAKDIDTLVANGRSLRAEWVDIGPLPDLETYLRIDLTGADELARFKQLLASVLPTILVETPFDPQRARRGASPAGKADASQPAKRRRSGRTKSAADAAQAPAAQPAPAPAPAAAHPVDSSAWTQLFEKGEYEALVKFIRSESLSDLSDSSESVSDASDSREPGRGSSGRVLADLERWIDGWLAWRDRSVRIAAGSAAAASSLAGRSFAEIVEEEKDVAHGLLPFFYRCEKLRGVDKPLPTVEPDFRPLNIICLLRVMGSEYFQAFVERAAEQVQVAYDSLRQNIKNKADRSTAHLLTFEPLIQLFENADGSGLPLWVHVQNGDDVELRVKGSIVDGIGRVIQELRDRFGCATGSLNEFIVKRGAQVEAMYQLFKTDRFPRTFFASGHFLFSFSEISFVGHHVDGPKPWLVKTMEKGPTVFLTGGLVEAPLRARTRR
ncbi:hypothetical protein BJY59DRAFT_686452 [Rhodotorula toruloides]